MDGISVLKTPLSPDQMAIVDMLKETLAMALEGQFRSIAILVGFNDGSGYSHAMSGGKGTAPEINMACDALKRNILNLSDDSAKTKAVSRIVRGRM